MAQGAPASPVANADVCSSINYKDEDGTIIALRMLYREEKLGQLDAMLGCLVQGKRDFSSGKPAGAAAYQFFRREMRGPGVTGVDVQRVERWAREHPTSMFAEFAALRLRYAFSWNLRGGAYASGTSEEQWRAFHKSMADTEAALYRASSELRDTSLWHQLLLGIAGDTKLSRGDMASVFEAGLKRWPTNYDLHEVMLTRLVPRWGGSWEHVDSFIAHFAGQREGAERDALYARLYGTLLLGMGDDPRATRLDWPRMKRGWEVLITRYPDPLHTNLASSFACVYKDAEYFKANRARFGGDEWRPHAWLRGTDFKACAQ